MPRFELVPLDEAMMKPATGKRAQMMAEYVGFIGKLQEGQAGKLQPSEGETALALRRRLSAAAKLAGKDIVIRRTGDEIYFWTCESARPRGRRGRSRKVTNSQP